MTEVKNEEKENDPQLRQYEEQTTAFFKAMRKALHCAAGEYKHPQAGAAMLALIVLLAERFAAVECLQTRLEMKDQMLRQLDEEISNLAAICGSGSSEGRQ